MGIKKFKLHKTELNNLISNLRGEVGDILITWLIFIKIKKNVRYTHFPDKQRDFQFLDLILLDKLENDIVARLSELAEIKIGQLNFYFALEKMVAQNELQNDLDDYRHFVDKNKLSDKRNQYISHKQLPENWTDHKEIYIPMQIIGKCLSLAVKLMIKIDKIILGPGAMYLWREVLKNKEKPLVPLEVNFILLPYMHLSVKDRENIIKLEMATGYKIWETIIAKINGVEREVRVCKKWSNLMTPNKVMVLDDYPILELKEINFKF